MASEVRNLALRSASAAQEIKALINDSAEKIDIGYRLADQAGGTMQEIVASVKCVNDIVSEITAASREQTSGIAQINQAVSLIDQATQQNAALVEEVAAASDAMRAQASDLAQTVSLFRISGTRTQSALLQ